MLLYYHSWMFYNHFIETLYHFFGTNILTQRPVLVAVFCLFLHRRKSISNGVQTPGNFLWIFYGPEDIQWTREVPGGAPRGAQPTRARQAPLVRPGGLCPPLWPPAPPLCTINSQIFQNPLSLTYIRSSAATRPLYP